MMDELTICGICLTTDVKMYRLRGFPLEDYYTRIIGSLLEASISRYFQYACYECAYHILKYNTFREKCLRSQSVLFEILQDKGQLTKADIKSIDRQKLLLCSKLAYGGKNINKVDHTAIKQEFNIQDNSEIAEPNLLVEISEIKVDYDSQEAVENKKTLNFDNEKHSSTIPMKKETSKKLKTKKTSESKGIATRRKLKSKDISEKKSTGETTGKKTKTPRRKQSSKKNPNGLTASELSMADCVEVIRHTLEEQLQELIKRKGSSNYMNAEFKCNLCYKGFYDPDAFDFHMKRHDPDNAPHICPVCKICFLTKKSLQKHRRNHEKNYMCKACSRISITMGQAKLHQKEHEGKIYKCEQCDYITMKWSSRLTHIRLRHPSDFVCDVCGFSFVSELGLRHHKTSRHRFESESESSGMETVRYCKTCDVRCNSLQMWKSHMATIAHKIKTNENLTCEKCNETFTTGEELRLHHRLLHLKRYVQNKNSQAPPKEWPCKCPHCDQMLSTVTMYYYHLMKSHPDKPYPITKNHICDICGKRFTSNAFVQYHRRTHFEERAFKCSQCPKSFFHKVNLQAHKLAHSDERPHVCDICHKGFKSKNALQKHSISHTDEKRYPCKYCGKAFRQACTRKIHIMTVHFKQPAPYRRRQKRTQTSADDSVESV